MLQSESLSWIRSGLEVQLSLVVKATLFSARHNTGSQQVRSGQVKHEREREKERKREREREREREVVMSC